MFWAGVTSCCRRTPLIVIEEGVKINQNVQLDLLGDKLVPWVESNMAGNGVTLQQDGATSHTIKLVQTLCKKHFKGFMAFLVPDLNPMDFGI